MSYPSIDSQNIFKNIYCVPCTGQNDKDKANSYKQFN